MGPDDDYGCGHWCNRRDNGGPHWRWLMDGPSTRGMPARSPATAWPGVGRSRAVLMPWRAHYVGVRMRRGDLRAAAVGSVSGAARTGGGAVSRLYGPSVRAAYISSRLIDLGRRWVISRTGESRGWWRSGRYWWQRRYPRRSRWRWCRARPPKQSCCLRLPWRWRWPRLPLGRSRH